MDIDDVVGVVVSGRNGLFGAVEFALVSQVTWTYRDLVSGPDLLPRFCPALSRFRQTVVRRSGRIFISQSWGKISYIHYF